RAQELGLKIFSYPEYLYEQSRDKKRVVIGGSHGKTTITAMILHVLKQLGRDFDYMVGAQLDGFDTMVRLTESAPVIILEGDEYLSSPIDRRPKFHLYHPHLALISGIAWDHINVFPTYEEYRDQFRLFLELIEPDGTLIYCEADPEVDQLVQASGQPENRIPYGTPEHRIQNGVSHLVWEGKEYPLQVFGTHNLQNLNGARLILRELGVDDALFLEAIQSFGGAARRLELLQQAEHSAVYKDFAHSPSKLKATTQAVKAQYPDRHLVACMELHTFSSLNATFLEEYRHAMDGADTAIVYYNPHTIAHKRLPPIDTSQVKAAFARDDLQVLTASEDLLQQLTGMSFHDRNLLLMSSGNFDGLDLKALAASIVQQ
ncbi:MAG: Mur ligase family protein, partial [Bacteroidota bacterium]